MKADIREKLVEAAKDAAENAYAPYSNYKVGAAILSRDGRIITGCNVENASYGLTVCAERIAVFTARSMGIEHFSAIAVFAPQLPKPMPCGACRQVLAEGGNNPLILVVDQHGNIDEFTLKDLLPHSFEL